MPVQSVDFSSGFDFANSGGTKTLASGSFYQLDNGSWLSIGDNGMGSVSANKPSTGNDGGVLKANDRISYSGSEWTYNGGTSMTPYDATALPSDLTGIPTRAGEFTTSQDGRTWIGREDSEGNKTWGLATFGELAENRGYSESVPIVRLMDDTALMGQAAANGYTKAKLNDTIDIRGTLADVRVKEASADKSDAEVELMKWQQTKDTAGMILSTSTELGKWGQAIAGWIYQDHRQDLENKMADLAVTKEGHDFALKDKMLDYQKEMTEDAQDLQCQTARIQENGKTQRARYAADVKKTAVKSQAVAEAFHRNGYYHGK